MKKDTVTDTWVRVDIDSSLNRRAIDAKTVAGQIKRHCDDVQDAYIQIDTVASCSYCGSTWTEDGCNYCCDKEIEEHATRLSKSHSLKPEFMKVSNLWYASTKEPVALGIGENPDDALEMLCEEFALLECTPDQLRARLEEAKSYQLKAQEKVEHIEKHLELKLNRSI